ncbi:hypothetical protein I317_06044 [Kwoniella heveanensis CBS 569]|nr:hypothetical protein I317_06044 [Kwoniella heveanensis CBS 569]
MGKGKADGDDENEDIAIDERWRPYDRPRIRHITGIRIHQLTLPESLALAPKPKSPCIPEDDENGDGYSYPLSPTGERSRRLSTSSFPFAHSNSLRYEQDLTTHTRERSSSSSTARPYYEPPSPTVSLHHTLPRTRVTRPRAPTLAGEALESGSALGRSETRDHAYEHETHPDGSGQGNDAQARRPMKCFITLKVPKTKGAALEEDEGVSERRRTKSDERDLRRTRGNGNGNSSGSQSVAVKRPSLFTRTSSSTSSIYAASLPTTPTKPNLIRPSISTSSSSSSLPGTSDDGLEPRRRTVSLNTSSRNIPNSPSRSSSIPFPSSVSNGSLSRTPSRLSGEDPSATPQSLKSPPSFRGLSIKKSRPSLSVSHQLANGHLSPTQSTNIRRCSEPESKDAHQPQQEGKELDVDKPKPTVKGKKRERAPTFPFYISSIHRPSTYPRFQGLEEGDFASWLTETESALDEVELEIWVEIPQGQDRSAAKWIKLDYSGRSHSVANGKGSIVKLSRLRRGPAKGQNGVEFTFLHDSKEVYHIAQHGEEGEEGVRRNIVERSMRETRMKRGAGFGGLHQLVNLQAVVADTQRSIEQVRREVDLLLYQDTDRSALRREIRERQSRIQWISEKVKEVEKSRKETSAKTTLRQQDIETRRRNLREAEAADELRHGRAKDLDNEIERTENERISLLPTIHALRAHHVQMLDTLFPIQPLDPSQLLYTILNVPLPIPIGPKDPAPPLSVPEFKVDERTTAAALGYVALLVQILGHLGGAAGGLPYVITCAGSKSAVRDGTGVMQGPRSFPLYAKGVERYRYEYAVFLLNKNIELLMQEANIRLLDLRHTLPNLKNLLLTLSSTRVPSSTSLHSSKTRSRDTAFGYGGSGHLGLGTRAGHGHVHAHRNESGASTPTLLNPFSGEGSGGNTDGNSRASSAAWPHLAQSQAQTHTQMERSRSPSAAAYTPSPSTSLAGDSPMKASLPTTSGMTSGQPNMSSPLKPKVQSGDRDRDQGSRSAISTPRHVHMRRSLQRAQKENHAAQWKLGSSVDLTSDGEDHGPEEESDTVDNEGNHSHP